MFHNPEREHVYRPVLIDRQIPEDDRVFHDLLSLHPASAVLDQFSSQKKELFKIQHPQRRLTQEELDDLYATWKQGKDEDRAGIWVFYPWLGKLIHILAEEEFVALRTSRNQYKITPDEQNRLLSRRIGIIGLSVGSAVALSMATERICGTLKLADFDVIELSNLNRLKTGIQNIGLNKCIVTAREIAEIDPFIQIECFEEGITDGNLNEFLTGGGNLDILIDECDDIEMKIRSRMKARELRIPVVMETSDRGMLDIERFDIEPDRSLFHGLLDAFPAERLEKISPQDRIPVVMQIVDVAQSSARARASLVEMGQTISTWPQLASAVTLGGAVVTDVCRRISLDQLRNSGRFYVDLENIISDKNQDALQASQIEKVPGFNPQLAISAIGEMDVAQGVYAPASHEIEQIVAAAGRAPSSGNEQPWRWIFQNNALHLFFDRTRAGQFANYQGISSQLALGAAFENALVKSAALGLSTAATVLGDREGDVAGVIHFDSQTTNDDLTNARADLAEAIDTRSTTRQPASGSSLTPEELDSLKPVSSLVGSGSLSIITDSARIASLSEIIGEVDRTMFLNRDGHADLFERNVRWQPADDESAHTGIPVTDLGLAPAQLAMFSMLRDPKVAKTLRDSHTGRSLAGISKSVAATASAFIVYSLPSHTPSSFFLGGQLMEHLWLKAEKTRLAVQPLITPIYLFARATTGDKLEPGEVEKLKTLRNNFRSIVNLDENSTEIFILKISKVDATQRPGKRLPLTEVLFMANEKRG